MRGRTEGLTLLEIVFVIMLTTIILGGVALFFQTGFSHYFKVRNLNMQNYKVTMVLDTLEDLLGRAVKFTPLINNGHQFSAEGWIIVSAKKQEQWQRFVVDVISHKVEVKLGGKSLLDLTTEYKLLIDLDEQFNDERLFKVKFCTDRDQVFRERVVFLKNLL